MKVASVTFQLLGAAIAGFGIWQTWRSHAEKGDRLWGTQIDWMRSRGRALIRWVRRVLKRPQHQTINGLGGISSGASFGRARLSVGMPPLPDIEDPTFAATVHGQIERAYLLAQKVEADVADERQDRREADAKVRADLSAKVGAVEQLAHEVAIGGLRLEVTGLALVVIGTAFGLFAR